MNSIFIVSIGRDGLLDQSLPYIREYCINHNIDINIIRDSYYDIRPYSKSYNYLTFEKNQVHDYLSRYDQVLRIDSDVLINPDSPNIFDYVPRGSVGGVFEDVRRARKDRRREIRRLQDAFNEDLGWEKDYFNSGVTVADESASNVFDINRHFIEEHSQELGGFKEQNLFNLKVREQGLPTTGLSPKWNRMSMFSNIPKSGAYFIHYAGPSYNEQIKLMERDIDDLL